VATGGVAVLKRRRSRTEDKQQPVTAFRSETSQRKTAREGGFTPKIGERNQTWNWFQEERERTWKAETTRKKKSLLGKGHR